MEESTTFLLTLLDAGSPSGYEEPAARLWRAEAEKIADDVSVDVNGTSYARLDGDGPIVVLEGHIDEIGLLVSYIDDDGFLWFQTVGGWDDQVLTGQHVRVMTSNGPIHGVIGRRPIHLLSPDERGKASQVKDLWIDIAARNGDQAREMVMVGDPIVIERSAVRMMNQCIAGRGLDNRVGSYVVLEALRLLAEGDHPQATVYAIAASQEEIGFLGARTTAFALNPDVAVVTDVTHATDHPNADKRGSGDVRVGGGPVLTRGSLIHPGVYQRLREAAEANDIPYCIEASGSRTSSDADGFAPARSGVPTGLVSFPNRYMHSPSELLSLDDLDASARLLAAFVRSLGTDPDFRRQ